MASDIWNQLSQTQKDEIRNYGCTIDQMREVVESSMNCGCSPAVQVVYILSSCRHMVAVDCQKEYELMNILDEQRQALNRAQWIVINYLGYHPNP